MTNQSLTDLRERSVHALKDSDTFSGSHCCRDGCTCISTATGSTGELQTEATAFASESEAYSQGVAYTQTVSVLRQADAERKQLELKGQEPVQYCPWHRTAP